MTKVMIQCLDPEILSDSDIEIMDSSVEWNPSNGYVTGYILDRLKIDKHDEEKRLKYASEDLTNLIVLLDEKLYAFLEQHGTEDQLQKLTEKEMIFEQMSRKS
ncbi:unnamed protein product [Acanthoscelides obtectus]|uniref:Uncharacterized protein n=1 Tax=Acanthoscelides obtectus TaxID=200917 RepID=A0A9P0P5X8_ACAOB|nr:unnamed protein product [Acanthoscelides obtectus]CAK1631187.1 hypothetical protein AOBTE_LOCUS6802 [Acanthoscelides obtectus]